MPANEPSGYKEQNWIGAAAVLKLAEAHAHNAQLAGPLQDSERA